MICSQQAASQIYLLPDCKASGEKLFEVLGYTQNKVRYAGEKTND